MINSGIKTRILAPLAISLIGLLGIFLIHSFTHEQHELEEKSEELTEAAMEYFNDQLRSEADLMSAVIEFLVKDPSLASTMIKRDRETARKSTAKVFARLKNEHQITHFYLHTPDRRVFHRAHAPESHGDLINRNTLLQAEKTGAPSYGIELGHFGHFTLRVVHPWIVDGALIGYIELGEEVEHILENMAGILDVDLVVTVEKRLLDKKTWEDGMRILGREADWGALSSSVVVGHTMGQAAFGLGERLARLGPDFLVKNYPDRHPEQDIYLDNRRYDVSITPIRDASGKIAARLIVLWDKTDFMLNLRRSLLAIAGACVVVGGALLALFYTLLDRIERRLKESYESLRIASEKHARLATAIEQADEIVMITNPDGLIEYVNPAFERVTGYARDEVLGKTPAIVKSGEHDDDFYRNMWQMIKRGDVWSERVTNRKKDGGLIELVATISPVLCPNGNIINYVCLQRDITKERRMERQMMQSQKMQAIGTLAGGIAHDFNNILTSIMGYAELTVGELDDTRTARRNLMEIQKASVRAKELIKQILVFSRDGDHEMGAARMSDIVEESLKLLRATLPRTIEIRHNIWKDGDVVMANETQITQVIMNLCSNAEYAMREGGGVLDVSLKPFEVDEEFAATHNVLSPGPHLQLIVSDTGAGMSKNTIERIFDPFYTTKNVGEGTGLGLSVAHGIVTAHKGAITVYSEPGRGSTFNVYLPTVGAVSGEKTPINIVPPHGEGRILCVDDEESIAGMMERLLSSLGYEVETTTEAMEALEKFKNAPDYYDIIITDQTMPKLTGVELTKEVLSLRPDMPVILFTGFSHSVDEKTAREAGVRDFVMKPVSKRVLADVISRALTDPS